MIERGLKWIWTISSSVFSNIFSEKLKDYERKIEELRRALDELENGTVPMIRVEKDDELISRAKGYIKNFKNQAGVALKTSLLPLIERLIYEIEKDKDSFWYKLNQHIETFEQKIKDRIGKEPKNTAFGICFIKRIDKVVINMATILISGVGIFTAVTKFNLPEINMSFLGENPFAIKRDITETTIAWIFSLLALFGLLLQVLREIYAETIPERLYKIRHYYLFFILTFLIMCAVVPVLTGMGQAIAKQKWLPKIIQSQGEVFQQANFIIDHDGWREDQLELKAKLDDPQKYININFQQADKSISQIEKLLELRNLQKDRKEKIENLRKYFK